MEPVYADGYRSFGWEQETSDTPKNGIDMVSIAAFTIGLVGCAFMAGSVFAVTVAIPHIILCAVLAIPGFLGWILPYFF